ncbi:MAG: histidine kinase, partial [Acidobacteriia bacterium]|nr:histidine kinase [Terriglobia bacterium]
MPELEPSFLILLLIKLGVVASIASILARWNAFQAVLLQHSRTLSQRLTLAIWLSAVFGASVATRVFSPSYKAADLGLEGSFLAGLLGGYVTGLLSGVLISLPAFVNHEHLSMPVLAGVGVLGGLLRDLAPDSEDIWDMSPFPDLSIYRFLRENRNPRRAAFHLSLLAAILSMEFVRQNLGSLTSFSQAELFRLTPVSRHPHALTWVALYATTLFAVLIPVKIWNHTRTERKLEEQKRLLVEARLAALTSQINPHFLFNTLNSVSSLIRTNPAEARLMILKLSRVLRRLLRKHENFSPLRDELSFIHDYLSIEVVRFGDKLRLETDVQNETLDLL